MRGAADREVAQAAADEAERLVAAELGHRSPSGAAAYQSSSRSWNRREAEEVVLLLEVLDGPLVDRAQVAGRIELVVGVVLLARHAVLALVDVELDVAGVVATLQQLGDGGLVARLGGADEVVVGDVQPLPRLVEQRGDRVGEVLRRQARGLGGLLDLQAVLVGAGQELARRRRAGGASG